jgi:lactose/L-arabinose transport system ATP-binding protein
MRVEISRLHKEIGATMIYVTHDQVEAMTLADKIVVLRDGRIEQIGSPMDLYQDPENIFVAGFIGSPSMNFLRGQVIGEGKIRVPALGDREIETGVTLPKIGQQVTVGLRPQALSVREEASPISVDIRERLGGVAYDYLKTPTGERIVVEIKGDDPIAAGTSVAVDFAPEAVFLFDSETTLRLS